MLLKNSKTDQQHFRREARARSLYSSFFFAKSVLGYADLTEHFHKKEMERFIDPLITG